MSIQKILLILFILLPVLAYGQNFNAGFVQGIWYSEKNIFVDEPVRIYVAVRNNTDADLTGVVEFYVNDKRIARNDVSALNGRIIESWADWDPEFGTHKISANLSRVELHRVGSNTETVQVLETSSEDTIFVDYDTDGDGVGNTDDADDDNDTIPDIEEEEQGTNPLVFDETEENQVQEEAEQGENAEEDGGDEVLGTAANAPQGFEQYLTKSRFENTLSGITQYVNQTKKRVDDYRERRAQNLEEDVREIAESAESQIDLGSVNEDGFGEIERATSGGENNEGRGFFATLTTITKTLLGVLYTGALAVVSFVLGYPALIQLIILIVILFGLYMAARRFGMRRNQ